MTEAPRHRAERRTPPWLIAVPLAVIVVCAGAFFLLKGGDSGSTVGNPPSSLPPSVPAFSFKVAKVEAVPTNSTSAKKLDKSARTVAASVGKSLSDMYRSAFLDQGAWQSGNYDTVWSFFDTHSAADAKGAVETLTLGTKAGDSFSAVAPGKGSAKVQVLMDDHNKPVSAVASVKFGAKATGTDGSMTNVGSTGDYFLRPAGKAWVIYAFKVSRKDKTASAPSPSASSATGGTPSAGTSP